MQFCEAEPIGFKDRATQPRQWRKAQGRKANTSKYHLHDEDDGDDDGDGDGDDDDGC